MIFIINNSYFVRIWKNQRGEAQMWVKNAQAAVSIPLGESKQLSAHFLLTIVLL